MDLKASAEMLLKDRCLNHVLEEMEKSYIDRFTFANEGDDRLRQNMACALRVVADFRGTLERLAEGEALEQSMNNPFV